MSDQAFDYEQLYRLSTDAALDYLYDILDDHLFEGRFDAVEEIMAKIDLDRGQSALGCGVLCITLPWDKMLPGRPAFYARALKYYRDTDRAAESILEGLETYCPSPGIPELHQLEVALHEASKVPRKG